jgi:hypothetical protein
LWPGYEICGCGFRDGLGSPRWMMVRHVYDI